MTEISILDRIIARKRDEVQRDRKRRSQHELEQEALARRDHRGFIAALRRRARERRPAVIAEIKKASPSKGLIRADFDPAWIARRYAAAGAACLSVLTDEQFFQGDVRHLQQARESCELPVIRKDFLIDPYQVAEAGAIGADCILLIVAALSPAQLKELADCAAALRLDVLVEVHDDAELDVALDAGLELIGINNRNLHDFHTDLETTWRLARRVPGDMLVVTESGIHSPEHVRQMLDRGIHGFLVGESLMRADDPAVKFRELFG